MNLKVCTVGIVIPLVAALAVSTAPAATAAVTAPQAPLASSVVQDIGICSGRSEVVLNARNALRNRITLDLRVFTNRAGDVWRVRITQNGLPIANQAAVARPDRIGVRPPLARRAASLTVRETAIDRRGVDRFVAMARNVRTGEVCTAREQVRDQFVRPPFERVRPPIDRVRPPIG
jgi:hypothetical protein